MRPPRRTWSLPAWRPPFFPLQNSDLGDKYGPARLLTSADDLDAITDNGTYWYLTESVPAHAPYSNAAVVEVSGSSSNATQKLQRVTRYGVSGQSAFRPLISSNGWLDWAYHLTNADIQKGRVAALSCPANTITEHKLVFPKAFMVAPRVMLTLNSSTESPKYGSALPFTTNITSTGCTIRVANNSDTTFSPNIEWFAIALWSLSHVDCFDRISQSILQWSICI